MNCRTTTSGKTIKRVTAALRSCLLFALLFQYAPIAPAEGIFSYAGFTVHQASVNLDASGATSIEDEASGFGLFAASRLYKQLFLEYGYRDLGEYSADYDFTVGSFRFVESHKLDFSQSLYAGLVFKSTIADIMQALGFKPALDKVYLQAALGGLVWRARMEMSGELYDSGTFLGPYGATGDDVGLSSYYEVGLGYGIGEHWILALTLSTAVDVGRGTEMELLDGTRQEFPGRNVETIGLGLAYSF